MKSPRWAASQQPGLGWAPCAPPTVWPGPHPIPGVPPPSWQDSTLASALQLEARPVLPEPKKAGQGAERRPWPPTWGSRTADSSQARPGRGERLCGAGCPRWRPEDAGTQPVPGAQRGRRRRRSHSAGPSSQGPGRRVGGPLLKLPCGSRLASDPRLSFSEPVPNQGSLPISAQLRGAARGVGRAGRQDPGVQKAAPLAPRPGAAGGSCRRGLGAAGRGPGARTHRLRQQEAAFERAEEGARRQEGAEPGKGRAGLGAAGGLAVRVGLRVWGPHGGGGRSSASLPLTLRTGGKRKPRLCGRRTEPD